MKNLIKCLAVLLVVCLSLSCCSVYNVKISDKFKAPEPSGELYEVKKAIADHLGEINYSYPRFGNYRSAVISADVNSRDKNEFFILYSTKTDDSRYIQHIRLVYFDSGKWNLSKDVQIEASEIHSVNLASFERSNALELVISLSTYNTKEKSVYVFSVNNYRLFEIMSKEATTYAVTDFDQDNLAELLTINLDSSLKTSVATLTTVENGQPVDGASCNLDGSVTEYSTPKITRLTDKTPAVFIDATTPSGTITEVVILEHKRLVSLFGKKETFENTGTLRASDIQSLDFDGDGCLDIPRQEALPQHSSITNADSIYLTAWQSIGPVELKDLAITAYNYTDGYFIEIPDKWLGNISIVRNTAQNERVFHEWLEEQQTIGTKICSIRVFSIQEWEKVGISSNSEYIEITRTSQKVFAFSKGESSLSPTLDELKQHFNIIATRNGGLQ